MSGKRIANQSSRNEESRESVKHRVRLFLVKNESGLAKIHRGIDTNFTKEGLNGILKQMVQDGEIESTTVKPKDPRYVLRDIGTFNAQVEGYTMKDYLSVIGLYLHVDKIELSKIKKYDTFTKEGLIDTDSITKTKTDISDMIFKFGLMSLHSILASYRKNPDSKHQEVFLKNALSFENNLNSAKFSEQVKRVLLKNIMAKENKGMENNLEVITTDKEPTPKMKKPRKTDYQKEASEMELVLMKMFPKMMKEFYLIENKIWKEDNIKYMMDVCKKNPDYLLE